MSFFFKPLSWVFILLISGLVLKDVKKKQKLLWASFVVLYVFTNPFLFNLFNEAWAIQEQEIEGKYDAAIVLLGFTSLTQEPMDRVHVSQAVNRVTQLIPLYRKGVVKKFILSGGSSALTERKKSEAEEVRKLLLEWKIPKRDIVIEGDSRNTYENLKNNKSKLKKYNRILLVTSSYHMRRSLAIADKLDIKTTPFVTDYIGVQLVGVGDYIMPSFGALYGFRCLIHEWIGYLSYSIRGYC